MLHMNVHTSSIHNAPNLRHITTYIQNHVEWKKLVTKECMLSWVSAQKLKQANQQKRVQAHLRDVVGLVPHRHNKVSIGKPAIIFVAGESCLHATCVKHSKAKLGKVCLYILNDSIYIKNSRKCKSVYDDKVDTWLPGPKGGGRTDCKGTQGNF